ncbi:MAG: ribosomal protein S18-alanine N-acetyltransferase [Ottowia sp.]|nr:ribosomal protein S18-alanine N-acetyltransferase [Ottowia sp.]
MRQAEMLAEAAAQPQAGLAAMTAADLDAVLEIEQRSYGQPWSRRSFLDSLHAGYHAQCLWLADTLLGYFVALRGLEEVHLLNLAVAPDWRRQGWARVLLEALVLRAQRTDARWLWLEVRAGNRPARTLYRRFGFAEVGLRKGYYPVGRGRHEDAVLMTLALPREPS